MPDHRQGAAGRDREADAVQDLAAAVVAETHVLEIHPRLVRDQGAGPGAVAHFLGLVEQAEQAFDVGDRLFHLAVDHAQEVQRRRQLQQIGVHQHQVADGHAAGGHACGGAPHQRGDADGDDGALAQVQHRQRLEALDRGVFHLLQVLVVAARLVVFVVEVLHRFVVEQRIHAAGAGAGVGLDRGAVVARAPFGHPEGPGHVDRDRA